jgi:hypothetical protein
LSTIVELEVLKATIRIEKVRQPLDNMMKSPKIIFQGW